MTSRGSAKEYRVAGTSERCARQVGEGAIAGDRGIEKLGEAAKDTTARVCERAVVRRRRIEEVCFAAEETASVIEKGSAPSRGGTIGKKNPPLIASSIDPCFERLQLTGIIRDPRAADCKNIAGFGADQVNCRAGIKYQRVGLSARRGGHRRAIGKIERSDVSRSVWNSCRRPVGRPIPIAVAWVELPGGAAREGTAGAQN